MRMATMFCKAAIDHLSMVYGIPHVVCEKCLLEVQSLDPFQHHRLVWWQHG